MPQIIYAQSRLYALSEKKEVSIKNLIESGDNPKLAMLWATHCKPCMQEAKILSVFHKAHKEQLDFYGIQVTEPIDSFAEAKKIHEEIVKKALGAQKDDLPLPYIAHPNASINDIWKDLIKQSTSEIDASCMMKKDMTAIPLFILFDKKKSIKKCWVGAIAENYKLMTSFFKEVEDAINEEVETSETSETQDNQKMIEEDQNSIKPKKNKDTYPNTYDRTSKIDKNKNNSKKTK